MNNPDPSVIKSDSKRYTFRLRNFTGARLKYEKEEFKKYVKIVVDGFIIHHCYDSYMDFSVDNQLIRRLKLKSLSNQIKPHSVEDKVLRLLEISDPYEPDEVWSSYSSYYNYESFYDYDKEILREQKRYQKYQSKQISQMANRYCKKSFRK